MKSNARRTILWFSGHACCNIVPYSVHHQYQTLVKVWVDDTSVYVHQIHSLRIEYVWCYLTMDLWRFYSLFSVLFTILITWFNLSLDIRFSVYQNLLTDKRNCQESNIDVSEEQNDCWQAWTFLTMEWIRVKAQYH